MGGFLRNALLAASAACLLVGASDARDLVLCIGSAGHVAVEASHGEDAACDCGACGQCEAALESHPVKDACGACIDVPLALTGAGRTIPNVRSVQAGSFAAAVPGAGWAAPRACAGGVPCARAIERAFRALQRNGVLRL
jgi:hypothetical protein